MMLFRRLLQKAAFISSSWRKFLRFFDTPEKYIRYHSSLQNLGKR